MPEHEEKSPTCFDCTHYVVCRYRYEPGEGPPWKSDDCIGPFLHAVHLAIASACRDFELEVKDG